MKRDGGLRQTSLEKLASLDPVKGQTLHTAGTSSQVSDGAAALILASEEGARRLGVEPRARIVTSTVVGVDPVTMLKGPIPATQKVLKDSGLQIDQIDTYEVNEAFASVVLAWMKACNPVEERLNPQGGAIALGHPTGSHRSAAAHHGTPHAGAHRRPLRPGRDVLRRWPRDRHHHRAGLKGMMRPVPWDRAHLPRRESLPLAGLGSAERALLESVRSIG